MKRNLKDFKWILLTLLEALKKALFFKEAEVKNSIPHLSLIKTFSK